MRFTGFFTSKRGTEWNYHFYGSGWVEMWHGTTERITGGWRIGRDVFSPHTTKECYQDILDMFGFEKNPDSEDAVIVPDFSHDELIEKITHKLAGYSTISRTPAGKIRVMRFRNWDDVFMVKMFDSIDAAKEYFGL